MALEGAVTLRFCLQSSARGNQRRSGRARGGGGAACVNAGISRQTGAMLSAKAGQGVRAVAQKLTSVL